MKKLILFFVLCVVTIMLCQCGKNKGCNPVSPHDDSTKILEYARANGMTMTAHASGLYYQVLDPGTGVPVSPTSIIYITYTGKLLDGKVIDYKDNPNETGWMLSGLIEGWRIGIPLIKEGGHIRLLIPSALAYGCEQRGSLPGNSILFFDITLVNVD